jgi:hypothetical protein
VKVTLRAPSEGVADASEVLATVAAARRRPPFDAELVELSAAVSQALFEDARVRSYPELVAFAFWARRTNVLKLREEFRTLATRETVLAPAGVVFHVAPGNVDTIFVYSWLLSMLVGNGNVVRVSSRAAPQTDLLCEVLRRVLTRPQHAEVRAATAVVTYPHDSTVTEVFSAGADLRVIWGGDETIRRIRTAPLAPHGRELTFPDRYSLAAIAAARYLALDEGERRDLATRFFNDTYWFDQMGCSSPRLVVWVGDEVAVREAAAMFYRVLSQLVLEKGYAAQTATAIDKLVFAYGSMIEGRAASLEWHANELVVVPIVGLPLLDRRYVGGGLFLQVRAKDLSELAPAIVRKDQTLTHFGFSPSQVAALATALNGRGIDRMVPLGDALAFSRFWDGYDLLQAMTRRIVVRADEVTTAVRAGGTR